MTDHSRRSTLRRLGAVLAVGLAGCVGNDGDSGGSPTAKPTPTLTPGAATPTTAGPGDGTDSPDGTAPTPTDRTGTPHPLTPAQEGVAWRYDLGAEIRTPPTVADGTVYVGGWRETGGGTPEPGRESGPGDSLFAFDAASGELQWQYRAGGPVQRRPRVVGDRIYVVRGYDGLHGHGYQVHGASPTGERLWTHEAPSLKFLTVLGADDSGVYVGTHDDNLGGGTERVTGLGPNGARKWRDEFSDVENGAVGPEAAYAASYTGRVQAYDKASGERRWTAETESMIPQVAGVVGDVVVLRDDGAAVALDRASGEERWRFDRFEAVYVTLGGKLAYVAGENGGVAALVATDGRVAWEARVGSDIPALAVAGTDAYLCHGDGTFVARHPATGERLWRRNVGSRAVPVPAGERVYALQPSAGRARALDARTGDPGPSFEFDGETTGLVPGDGADVVTTEGGAVYGLARD